MMDRVRLLTRSNMLAVLGVIVANLEDDGCCRIGVTGVSDRSGVQRRCVHRVLVDCEHWGLVERIKFARGTRSEIRITKEGWAFRKEALSALFPEVEAA